MSPRHQSLQNTAWANCDRCGFVHPVGMLVKQKGRLLCRCHNCLDNLTVEKRQRVIAQMLSQEESSLRDRQEQLSQTSDEENLEF